jgi:hypothetical protein
VEIQNIGYCGLNCEACPLFIARVTNDDNLRQKTAPEWTELYADYLGIDAFTKEDMNCDGCRSEQSCFIGCRSCPIRDCCRANELNTCASCIEYTTCGMLNGFYTVPSHQPAKDILDTIRKNHGVMPTGDEL